MTVLPFHWDPSTSVANLTDIQLTELCEQLVVPAVTASAMDTMKVHVKPNPVIVWSVGMMFVTVINLCAIAGIGVMRYLSKSVYNQVITLFVGLGVGSLSGSSFYHLIPQSHPVLVEAKNEHGELTYDYLHMAHFSICGVYLFFMCDKVIKIFLEAKKKKRISSDSQEGVTGRSDASLLHGIVNSEKQSEGQLSRSDAADVEMMKLETNAVKSMGDQPRFSLDNGEEHLHCLVESRLRRYSTVRDGAHGICVHDHTMQFRAGDSAIAAVAWMILFGDGFHNFIDGISIGASFTESIHSGLSVSIAVLCEEFPHELGDVAILVASGMSLRQALLYNLLSALTCYIGFGVGVAAGESFDGVNRYAFALAGGMFLYISLGCMMPEMRKAVEEALQVSLARGLYVLFLQSVGLFSGLFLMYFMARYGEEIFNF